MAEPDAEPMGTGHRLGAPETLGISTLDPGHRPPAMPPGRLVTVRVRMLDDTEELFDISLRRRLQKMGVKVAQISLLMLIYPLQQ
ncbi:hypothetical protein CesoFtcFv8_013861 [Champsocephalus esox]|uniref:Uncharacterized protein n=1 Tax=Champsocephalus esox TaxID=159716 RepID=A0AAN8BS01_9TELE|nr:hypothetical protein CesoFtcFv8_013861 [Champsocephalus esox]